MAYWLLGRIAEKNKDMVEAEKQYRAGIAATHSGARSWLELAIFFRHVNRLDDMERALREMFAPRMIHFAVLGLFSFDSKYSAIFKNCVLGSSCEAE